MRGLSFRMPQICTPYQARAHSSTRDVRHTTTPLVVSSFHSVGRLSIGKRDSFSFSSKAPFLHSHEEIRSEEKPGNSKRKTRSAAAKNSLRRVAVEAQRSRDGKDPSKTPATSYHSTPKVLQCCDVLIHRLTHLYKSDGDSDMRGGRI